MSAVRDSGSVLLRYPPGSAVLVAGVPGAGKSTLVARFASGEDAVRVLDTDPLRARWARVVPLPYPLWRPALHAFHLTRAWWVLGRPPAVVVVEPGTRPWVRRAFLLRAARAGRPLHLLGIEASVGEARAGQLARRRTIRPASLERHAARWAVARDAAADEGFASVRLLSRTDARAVSGLAVAASSAPWSSRRRSWWSPVARLASGVRWRSGSPRKAQPAWSSPTSTGLPPKP